MSGVVSGVLDGRVAVVTGAANGLGRAEALALARAGASLVLNDLPGFDPVVDDAVVVPGDVGEWSTGERLVAAALEAYGRLDILVNNAGVLRDRMIFSMSPEEWDTVLRVHLRGHFVTTRFATAYWRDLSKQAGGPVYGRIVNTSSEAFLLGSSGQPNYAAAKAGIAALTVTTARSCARYGVRANAICPRARTAMTAGLMGPPPADSVDPLAPEHVAPLVVYLASPAGEAINGEVFVVHGGVAAVMEPPRMRAVFRSDAPDGMWTLESVGRALAGLSSGAGFMCEDTMGLASETIGFPGSGLLAFAAPHRYVGGLQRLPHHTGQVILDRVQVHGVFQPRCERRHHLVSVVAGPVEPSVHRALDPPPQRAEQRRRGQRGRGHRHRRVKPPGWPAAPARRTGR
ncbi:MAG TPA: SDR family oxidoreductase [Streptosporangiaceae bacterium]|nr:SDR family oxidoreductase [Streptosporangiaceae bacterium]